MPVSISNILREYVKGIKNIFGCDYEKTILYGSYARGDNRLDSDIDIMILVKCDDDMIHQYMRAVRDYTYDINEKYDSEIMPIERMQSILKSGYRITRFIITWQRKG